MQKDFDRQRFEAELSQAQSARLAGNEGMARVNARRAAGLVAGAYLRRRGLASPATSAYDRLRAVRLLPDLPQQVAPVIEHFLQRITPEHELPVPADLLAEARWLAFTLLAEGSPE